MKRAVPPVDPLCLPVGTLVGPWRVLGWGGRGSYGTLYKVEKVAHEAAGCFALKLACLPGDKRFAREAWLLSHVHSPHVPSLQDAGVWQHPAGPFPYVVMAWVEGEPLYDWAARRNPTSRQMLRLLAQAARALEATHAAGAQHRDVKGSNILVRPADGHVFLIDFGAGNHRGASTLTSKLLPPGTAGYRSPEAWGFVHLFSRHPTVIYPASACDDLFALGVTAYRLVTDEYPPLTCPQEPESVVWREAGPGPRPPRALNPRVSPELEAAILRLLAIAPEERFGGQARLAAETLEQAALSAGPEADSPLFILAHEHLPRLRSPGGTRLAEREDAEARQELAQQQAQEPVPTVRGVSRSTFAPVWAVGSAVVVLAVVLTLIAVSAQRRGAKQAQAGASAAVAEGVRSAALAAREPGGAKVSAATQPMPDNPLPGQRKPPCHPNGQIELRGGCWRRTPDARPPCEGDVYDLNGTCYAPVFLPGREPTSSPQ